MLHILHLTEMSSAPKDRSANEYPITFEIKS